ncbi:hypothetical protein ACQCSX_04485 [Pseudarthrobacter sp. P1]|uniref:hypothetical protein n=1 Tax=Pseudarthrobacter sp. P1 TaxID=3418418 RepID=UPI003CE74B0F
MSAWADGILARVLPLAVSVYETGRQRDMDPAAGQRPVLHVAEAVGIACAAHGIYLPLTDTALAAVAARDGAPAAAPWGRGAIVVLADGRVGLTAGRGAVIESAGESLAIIRTPEPGRYVAAWQIPGAQYWKAEP